ncbi:MAG: DUF4384 domain-containing protein [Treponema sp.]|jgi:hypothetical protein|nr:DUF4384 domain-containing protein [Treponema sp.]
MKKLFFLPVLLFAAVSAFAQSGRAAFDWSIALVNQRRVTGISADKTMRMETGDIFHFLIKSEADCFVYVIAQDSDNSVFVFHRGSLEKGKELRAGPAELTPPSGTETFFVVVSAAAQRKLDQALEAHQKNPNSPRAARAVMGEVFAIRRDISSLDQHPEQPVYMGGTFRGGDVSLPGLRFSGSNAYVRTFNISH